MLSKRVEVCSAGIVLRGRESAQMEDWIEVKIARKCQGKGY